MDGPPFPFQWLNGERVIQRLVELIHPSEDEDVSTVLARSPRSGGLARAVHRACRCLQGGPLLPSREHQLLLCSLQPRSDFQNTCHGDSSAQAVPVMCG